MIAEPKVVYEVAIEWGMKGYPGDGTEEDAELYEIAERLNAHGILVHDINLDCDEPDVFSVAHLTSGSSFRIIDIGDVLRVYEDGTMSVTTHLPQKWI